MMLGTRVTITAIYPDWDVNQPDGLRDLILEDPAEFFNGAEWAFEEVETPDGEEGAGE